MHAHRNYNIRYHIMSMLQYYCDIAIPPSTTHNYNAYATVFALSKMYVACTTPIPESK